MALWSFYIGYTTACGVEVVWAATSRRRGDGYKVIDSTVAHVRPRKSGRGCRLPTVKHVSKSSRLGSLVYSCCCRFAAAAAALSLVLRTGKKQQSPHVLVVKDQATKSEIDIPPSVDFRAATTKRVRQRTNCRWPALREAERGTCQQQREVEQFIVMFALLAAARG